MAVIKMIKTRSTLVACLTLTLQLSLAAGKPGNLCISFTNLNSIKYLSKFFLTDGCGIRANVQTRIVGGEQSYPGKWPWMAGIFQQFTFLLLTQDKLYSFV